MDPQGIMLSQAGQNKKDKILYELTYMWNLKKKKKKLTYTENRLVDGFEKQGVRGGQNASRGSKGTNFQLPSWSVVGMYYTL